MMYLLDTNVLSELRKVQGGKADPQVAAWARSVDAADLFISAITVMELGVLSIERKDATQGALLRAWLEQRVLPEFATRTLPIDTAVAQRCARLHVPGQRAERNALIAPPRHWCMACAWPRATWPTSRPPASRSSTRGRQRHRRSARQTAV